MARPADWQPLADSDPVPGDPAGINAMVTNLRNVVDEIAGQVAVLRKIAASQSDERGQHIEKLKAAAADTAGKLDKATGRYRDTAAALQDWVPELEFAQSQSLKALAQAQDAQSRQRASQPVQRPSGSTPTPDDQQQDQARARALNQANDDLEAARGMLDQATAHRDEKAAETAARIESAAGEGSDGFWQSLWADVKSFTDRYAWLIKDICTALEVIALILALVALCIPGLDLLVLGVIGAVLTGMALIGRTMLAATGNGSWAEVAMDVLGLATFGAGRIIGGALEGATAAVRAAAEESGAARVLASARPVLETFLTFTARDGMMEITASNRLVGVAVDRSVVEAARLPEFAEGGEQGLKAGLPRVLSLDEESGKVATRTVSYVGEHFPEVDTSAASSQIGDLVSAGRIFAGLERAHQIHDLVKGVEWEAPGSPPAQIGGIPGVGHMISETEGKWTTTRGGLPLFQ